MALPADLGTRLLDQAIAEAKKTNAQDGATWLAQQLCSHDCPEQLARGVMDKYVAELPQTGKKAAYAASKARSTLREVYATGKAQIMAWKLTDEPKGQPLSKGDIAKLERSWIDADIAAAACLRRVTDEEGRAIVGAERRSGNMAGIVFPYVWPGTANIREYRLRRDKPDVEISGTKRKEIAKYLSPPGRGNMLYFPPATEKSWLQDPSLPILITEGEKKTLALFRLARTGKFAGFPVRFLPVGLSGVWNWRGTTGKTTGPDGERLNEKGVIADMKRVVWSGRRVLILFDANVRTNESVQAARRELARWLVMEHGASVLFADLPNVEGVNGVDDYLAAYGPERTIGVIKRAKPCPFKPPREEAEVLTEDERSIPAFSGERYISTSRGILMWSTPREGGGRVPSWLTNFQAEVIADVEKDDGETKTRALRIKTLLNGRHRDVVVSPTAFAEMTWPLEELGARAIIYPGQKQNAIVAIQKLSTAVIDQYLYQHTGWTQIQGQHVYLHAGGAIGASGMLKDVAVELDREMRRYELPEPPKGRALVEAVKASLRMLKTAPDRVTIPLFCAAWRSVLGTCDVSLHLAGQTGSGKSQEAALIQQHFGPTMDAKHLPASWDSTANALQAIAFHAKNAICVVDDFVPKGSAADVSRMHREADRLLRAQGNNAGRQRMTAGTELRPPKTPRGIILSTGEDVPKGNSLRARLVLIEMEPDDMQWDQLTACQRDAAAGLYAAAMAGFIQWLAPKMGDMPQRIFQQLSEFREQWGTGGHHMRTPDNLANLSCGLEVFLEFAQEIKAISERDAGALWGRAMDSFKEAAAEAQRSQSHAEPTQQFLTYVAAAIAKGEAHLVSLRGEHPDTPEASGWKFEGGDWKPLGTRIGWISGETVYLHPENSYAAAQRIGRDISDTIAISQQTLGMRLKQRGLLLKCESHRRVTTARVSTSTGRPDAWWVSWGALYAE